jgi:hypothetical protein
MDGFDRAHSAFKARLAEVAANAAIRENYRNLFIRRTDLYSYNSMPAELKTELDRAMALKNTEASTLYRGLILEANAAFELFVRQIIEAAALEVAKKVDRYSELDKKIRDGHALNSAAVLSKLHDGEVNGNKYDFDNLQSNLGLCFSDSVKFALNTDVFAIFIGTYSPDKIKKVFEVFGIGPPFDDATGRNAAIKKWAKGAGTREARKLAQEFLENQIKTRNLIAHGSHSLAVLASEVTDSVDFFTALADAFVEKARAIKS